MPGYCTEEDVRTALQEKNLQAELASEFVGPAIEGQTEWLRKRTQRHWYDSGDTSGELFTSALSVTDEQCDIPSTPHPEPRQFRLADQRAYPKLLSGPYTRVELDKRRVDSLTALEVRDSTGEMEDWVAASGLSEGRGDAYYTQTDPHTGRVFVYLDAAELPVLWDYAGAVLVSYDYGVDGIPETIRRAVAFRAGAELVLDDDAIVGVPDNGQLVNVETKAQAMRNRATELLGPYLEAPVA